MANRHFAGTGALVRFTLRRERIRLTAWIVGIVVFSMALMPVFDGMFSSAPERRAMAETMLNPAMIALVGPVYGVDNYHVAAMFANMMLTLTCVIVGIMNIFLITRGTRNDEEQGRLEVIRSLPVGRLSGLSAALLTALGTNFLIAALTGLGLSAFSYDGVTFDGSMLYGAVLGATGLVFAAATAVFCQLTANGRTATSLSILLLAVWYLLRAVGDLGTEILSLLSPMGLVLRAKVYVEDIWWPVPVVLVTAAALAVLALVLARVRDLGRGLWPERPGRRHASKLLGGPLGLALRLTRTTIIAWAVTIFLFAAMYASIFGDLENFIASNEMLSAMVDTGGGRSFTEQFIGLLMVIMSLIATIPVLNLMLRVRGEERQGHTEHLLGRSVSRTGQFAAYFGIALVMSAVLQLLIALGFWSVGSMVMETGPSLMTFLQAATAYLPAMWVMLGLAGALAGWLPDRGGLTYGYLVLGFFLVYIGALAQLPEITAKLTPFGHVGRAPVEEIAPLPLAVMTGIAATLAILGFMGYRRRDMKTG